MHPDVSPQNPAAPLSVPPVASQAPYGQPLSAPSPGHGAAPALPGPAGPGNDSVLIAQQARQLVERYGHEPFYLSNALQQVKQEYLTNHFHISIKTAEK